MRFDRLMEQLVGIFALVVPGGALAFGFFGVFIEPALLTVAHAV